MTLIDEKTRFKAEQFGEGYYFVIQVTYDFPGGAHVASVTGFTEFGVACPASWAHANLLAAAPRLLAALKQARAALPDAWAAVACNVPHAVVEEINAAIAEAEAPGPRKGSTAGHDCKAVTERAVHPWGGRKLLTALILAVTVAASPSSGAVEPLRDGTSMRAARLMAEMLRRGCDRAPTDFDRRACVDAALTAVQDARGGTPGGGEHDEDGAARESR